MTVQEILKSWQTTKRSTDRKLAKMRRDHMQELKKIRGVK
jgi:hypothetical protein